MNSLVFTVHKSGPDYPESQFSPGEIVLEKGCITAILGESGIGKSTFLHCCAGLLQSKEKAFVFCGLAPGERIALMGQDDALLPWFTVLQNASLGARLRGEKINADKVGKILHRTGLAPASRFLPRQLSTGMRQRVALARSLLEEAGLILLDEPFSSLDAFSRRAMQDLALMELAGKTVVLVTHDPGEAVRMAHHIYIMHSCPARFVSFGHWGRGNGPRADGDVNGAMPSPPRSEQHPAVAESIANLWQRMLQEDKAYSCP